MVPCCWVLTSAKKEEWSAPFLVGALCFYVPIRNCWVQKNGAAETEECLSAKLCWTNKVKYLTVRSLKNDLWSSSPGNTKSVDLQPEDHHFPRENLIFVPQRAQISTILGKNRLPLTISKQTMRTPECRRDIILEYILDLYHGPVHLCPRSGVAATSGFAALLPFQWERRSSQRGDVGTRLSWQLLSN